MVMTLAYYGCESQERGWWSSSST